MKILRLDLLAFGPFTDVTLDLAAGRHGLHLIYGPNEAGKSSALRALRQLFFGIEERTSDAFLHPYANLRLGAAIRHRDGSELEFIRRKGIKNTLREAGTGAILDPKDLNRFLGGVDEKLFQTMFGIDREALEQGGREIVQGGGQLGQVLFAAGAGIANLRDVQKALKRELDELFLPRGKTQKINKALGEFHDAQDRVKSRLLSGEEWSRHDRALSTAQETRDRLVRERQERSLELSRLTRIRDALPGIARWKELNAEREAHREVVLLSPEFGKARGDAMLALRLAEEEVRQAEQNLAQLDRRLARLDVPEALLENGDAIEQLLPDLGSYRKAMIDRPRLLAWRQQMEHGAREILRSLGRPADLDQAEPLRLLAGETGKVQTLAGEQQKVTAHLDNARQVVAGLQSRMERVRQQLAQLPVPQDPGELQQALKRAQREGDLEERLKTEQATLRRAERQAGIDLVNLGLWSGTLDELEKLPVPAPESVDRFETDLRALQSDLAGQRDLREKEEAALGELDRQIEHLKLHQDVPSEEDLTRERGRRDAGWQLVRRAWFGQNQEDGATRQIREVLGLPTAGPLLAADLAEAYERGVQRADQVGDRLRREADRVATQAKLLADRNQRRLHRDRLSQRVEEIEAQLREAHQAWSALWRPLGIEPLSPREMQVWLRRHHDLLQQARAIRGQRDTADRLRQGIDAHCRRLRACLERLGDCPNGQTDTLTFLVENGQDRVKHLADLHKHRGSLEQTITDLEWDLREADARLVQAEKEALGWQMQWARAMTRMGLEADLTPAEANAMVEAIRELFQKLHDADTHRRRIDGIDRDARQFQADVRALVERLAADLGDVEVERAVAELHGRLTRARAAAGERASLTQQRRREAERLDKAGSARTAARIQLEAMCHEARCAVPEELPLAEQRSARRRQLETDLETSATHLRALSAGATVEAFIAQAAQVEADGLSPEIDRLKNQMAALDEEISRLDNTIGSEQTLLAAMDGSAAAAEAAEQSENLLAQLQGDVEDYIRLRLAAAVLQKGIERYRDKNQGPVLDRASCLFANLTAGSFEGLRIDYHDGGEPVLIGVRPGGRQTVGVDGMSDGCGDQLYLALRLASLEAWLKEHEPIPFIVDDILLNFDNDRSIAALKALADLSRHTQVIFFTHHQHLIELAERHLEADLFFTHQLGSVSVRV